MVQCDLLRIVETSLDTACKDELKVELLALVSDVDDTVCLLLINTVAKRSHVSGVVVEATV